ncbi:hypothetical protein GOODEAATRI_001995, partial [Goodea atripinnis]
SSSPPSLPLPGFSGADAFLFLTALQVVSGRFNANRTSCLCQSVEKWFQCCTALGGWRNEESCWDSLASDGGTTGGVVSAEGTAASGPSSYKTLTTAEA